MQRHRLCLLLMLLFLAACIREEYIDLPASEKPRIVITSHFTAGEPLCANISLSQPITSIGSPQEVLPAGDVTLAADGIFLNRLFPEQGPGGRLFWKSRALLKPGVRYSITARFPGYDTVQASDTIPAGISAVSMKIKKDSIRTVEDTTGLRILRVPIVISVNDLPAQRRYFAFGLQHELRKSGPTPPNSSETKVSGFLANGRTLALTYGTPEGVFLLNENYWNDGRKTIELEVVIPYRPNEEEPTRLLLEWRTLSEAYYRYHLSLATQGSPLSDPDAFFNNIQGGYGNFSGFARLRLAVALPE
ncbi:MAG: DUF4249 family protein [Saprospiraceae bacterium]|nr:DUF4249 domain-containing protein [Saprospiraceae bacterium]MDW8229742.1 DUF4249 family protein [Saprospiraceae bacterium]